MCAKISIMLSDATSSYTDSFLWCTIFRVMYIIITFLIENSFHYNQHKSSVFNLCAECEEGQDICDERVIKKQIINYQWFKIGGIVYVSMLLVLSSGFPLIRNLLREHIQCFWTVF